MNSFYITDSGKVREQNEDSVTIVNKDDEYLLVVADGMGGHHGGEIASSIAVKHLEEEFLKKPILEKEELIEFIKRIVSEANLLIYKYTREHPESEGMGTTIVLAIKTKNLLIIGNIGDSRGYVVKTSKLYKMTTDHTLVNLLVKSGKLTEEEAKDHPRKNVLMRALGASETVEMDIYTIDEEVEGVFLCSDGLTNMLNDEQIEKVINEKIDIESKLNKLVQKANNRGGLDNIAIAYLDIRGEV